MENLKDKAIDIKGKQYVLVSDRVIYFNENYPKGCIITELISPIESKYIVMKAMIYPDGMACQENKETRCFTGYSQAIIGEGYINKTSALENAETSAVGRALGMMGIGVLESIASADEMNKAMGSGKVEKKTSGTFCTSCGAEGVVSAKTGKPYCPNFLKHKKAGEKYSLKSKEEERKMTEIAEQSQNDYDDGIPPF